MKKLIALLFALSIAPAHASITNYYFDGIVDSTNWEKHEQGSLINGSFSIDWSAPLTYQYLEFGGHYNAVSNIRYEIGGISYEQAGTWTWVVCDLPEGNMLGFRDAVMTGGGAVNASLEVGGGDLYKGVELENSATLKDQPQKSWVLTKIEAVGEQVFYWQTGGRIMNIWEAPQYASAGLGDYDHRDAAPVPEPASLFLLASGLAGWAGVRKFRKGSRR